LKTIVFFIAPTWKSANKVYLLSIRSPITKYPFLIQTVQSEIKMPRSKFLEWIIAQSSASFSPKGQSSRKMFDKWGKPLIVLNILGSSILLVWTWLTIIYMVYPAKSSGVSMLLFSFWEIAV
jgi:hypothetical protein